MTVREIIKLPDKRLRLVSEPVKRIDASLRKLVEDMFETLYAAPGIGLAGIQVGVAKRVIIMDLSKKDDTRKPEVFINPEITWASEEKSSYEEGCLSIPEYYEEVERPAVVKVKYLDLEKSSYEEGCLSISEYYEEVERPAVVKVKYLDLDGKAREVEASGLLATCLQHEIDHLNGILFIDHISKLKRDRITKKFAKAAKTAKSTKKVEA